MDQQQQNLDRPRGGEPPTALGSNQPLSYIDGVEQPNQLGVGADGGGAWRAESPEEVVQVVYQSNQNGSLVGVESSLVSLSGGGSYDSSQRFSSNASTAIVRDADKGLGNGGNVDEENVFGLDGYATNYGAQQQARPTSTLPSVAEESSGSGNALQTGEEDAHLAAQVNLMTGAAVSTDTIPRTSGQFNQPVDFLIQQTDPQAFGQGEGQFANQGPPPAYEEYEQFRGVDQHQQEYPQVVGQPADGAIYSTVNKQYPAQRGGTSTFLPPSWSNPRLNQSLEGRGDDSLLYINLYQQQTDEAQHQSETVVPSASISSQLSKNPIIEEDEPRRDLEVIKSEVHNVMQNEEQSGALEVYGDDQKENLTENVNEISHMLYRHKQGAAESGSFRHNFRKKLGLSVSSNETDLTTHRQRFFEAQEVTGGGIEVEESADNLADISGKFKRTHSVSFNVNSVRGNRHSVDIRNLPSYLTVKRASIVDMAKGAMSSLVHSFGSGGASGASSTVSSHRRGNEPDEEPIFEEPIAPTLSLGQRVALIKNSGAEFGTVGWIGQLPDVDDDWIVGVIFDNMIGNCDGFYNGVRYFYARENYAMFVPLSLLTKTDNYVGRPETGTMLSRMSVSLKPGQLISIQRSSIRLQHCFLNAPHQRVGHDVRAVSNRLHCQCHNCGPCAHLTKQSRINTLPHFGSHHIAKKKNSLAHAAVEVLAHHHHHYHDEEEAHDEEDYQFGDNTAHACNFVRYSCCQQSSTSGHEFSHDCGLVRPELLDNLIHAPRAPHQRSRPRKRRAKGPRQQLPQLQKPPTQVCEKAAIEGNTIDGQLNATGTMVSWTTTTSTNERRRRRSGSDSDRSSPESRSSRSRLSGSSRGSSNSYSDQEQPPVHTLAHSYQVESSTYQTGMFNTIDSGMTLLDQRRFIRGRESANFVRSTHSQMSNESFDRPRGGLLSSIRNCVSCMLGRKTHAGRRRKAPKKRKASLRNRAIEYRRKQSTFVPSTLAKPHEDFASHGIIMDTPKGQVEPERSGSDYSSYSRSSPSSSGSMSPRGHPPYEGGNMVNLGQQETMTTEQNIPPSNEQLKSAGNQTLAYENALASRQLLNYEDYSFSDRVDSYKKNNITQDSALTDLGFCETCTLSSNDTLKSFVEKSINEEAGSQPEPLNLEDYFHDDAIISPIQSNDGNEALENICQIDISSPTVSCDLPPEDELDMCQNMENLDLEDQLGDDQRDDRKDGQD